MNIYRQRIDINIKDWYTNFNLYNRMVVDQKPWYLPVCVHGLKQGIPCPQWTTFHPSREVKFSDIL